jgi:hypothetical protein
VDKRTTLQPVHLGNYIVFSSFTRSEKLAERPNTPEGIVDSSRNFLVVAGESSRGLWAEERLALVEDQGFERCNDVHIPYVVL